MYNILCRLVYTDSFRFKAPKTPIQKYIEVINRAHDLHALIVEGAPGWGKTTAVDDALKLAGEEGVHLGAYSTPLHLFNVLAENPDRIVLIDDCSGLFLDKIAMAILKSATWPSENQKRVVKWGSTSGRALLHQFEFTGKLIIICNSFPNTPDGEAIRSRGFTRRIDISLAEAKGLLTSAAENERWFTNTEVAKKVAQFLIENSREENLAQINFRTLKKGYRLAEMHEDIWKDLFLWTFSAGKSEKVNPERLIIELAKMEMRVKDQERLFQEKTGLKRRTFYNYRKEIRLEKTECVL